MTTPTKPPYSVPTTTTCFTVRLDEFSIEEIHAYLAQRYEDLADLPQQRGLLICDADLDCITTLSIAGHRDSARELVLKIVGDKIGRAL